MIIEEYDKSLFIQRFENYNRVETKENLNGNFSYEGLRHLFEYLDEAHDEENPLKLDVIGLCCDFSEYKDLNEFKKDYPNLFTEHRDDYSSREAYNNALGEEISDKTTLIKFGDSLNDGFIIGQY